MAKDKGISVHAISKTQVLDDIRKRNLKVVIYRNKYLCNDISTKSDLIKKLVCQKKKVLKLHKSTDNDLHPEDEKSIHEDEISKVLEQEKKNIFSGKNDSDSDYSPPDEILETNRKWKKTARTSYNACNSKNENEKNLNRCLGHLHTSAKPFWNSRSCLMKAIKDSILRRKWNNLTHLLLMLIHLPSLKPKPLIRH
ncbi:hypothetical protein NQ314_004563, partial [Rhamnusium bicolor]